MNRLLRETNDRGYKQGAAIDRAKLGRDEALRTTMLTYMNDKTSQPNAYPAFWGPFSIIGEGAAR